MRKRPQRRGWAAFPVVLLACLAFAPAAVASVSASYSSGDLVVAGTDAADDIQVSYDSANDRYVLSDADGVTVTADCTTAGAPANTLYCARPDANPRRVVVQGDPPADGNFTDDGNDTVGVGQIAPGDSAEIDGEGGDDQLSGSPGADVIDCGSGGEVAGDTAHEDARDTLTNCEHHDLNNPPRIHLLGVANWATGGFTPSWSIASTEPVRVSLAVGPAGGRLGFYGFADFPGSRAERTVPAVTVEPKDLRQNTRYAFQATITNSTGSATSETGTFTTGNPLPLSSAWFTNQPDRVFLTATTSFGRGGSGECHFEYVSLREYRRSGWKRALRAPSTAHPFRQCTDGYPADVNVLSYGFDKRPAAAPSGLPPTGLWVTGLKPGVTYRYRVVMQNTFFDGLHTLDGASYQFTTAGVPKAIANGVQMTVPVPVDRSNVGAALYADGAKVSKLRVVGRYSRRDVRRGALKVAVRLSKKERRPLRRGRRLAARLVISVRPPPGKGPAEAIHRRVRVRIR